MKKVAIIGTQGVPANYGGFESMVENIITGALDRGIQYTVFCSSKDKKERIETYKGAILKYIPLSANGAQSIPYDIWSMIKAIRGYDIVMVLGVSGCLFLPIFRLFYRKKLIINIDGLEHRRDKWGKLAKWVLLKSEAMAVRFADIIISDNKGIQDYVTQTYGKDSTLIAYGGDHVLQNMDIERQTNILAEFGVKAGEYCITICRIEPENNCHVILEAFSKSDRKILFIGNWERSEYGRKLKSDYAKYPNITISDPVYDIEKLYALRNNASTYIHGHSAGGTNPSLVEAMFFGKPIVAYDVVYNRETMQNSALFFKDANELTQILSVSSIDPSIGSKLKEIAKNEYTWRHIVNRYEELY